MKCSAVGLGSLLSSSRMSIIPVFFASIRSAIQKVHIEDENCKIYVTVQMHGHLLTKYFIYSSLYTIGQSWTMAHSLQCRRIFGKRTLSTSSRNLKAEEGWGEIDIPTKGVVDRRPSLPTFTEIE